MTRSVSRPPPRSSPAWLCTGRARGLRGVGLGASQLLFALGDISFDTGAGSPSFADALYLGGDAVLIVAIGLLVASAGSGRA